MCALRNELHNIRWFCLSVCVCTYARTHVFYSAFQALIDNRETAHPSKHWCTFTPQNAHVTILGLFFILFYFFTDSTQKKFNQTLCALLYWNCSHTSAATQQWIEKYTLFHFPQSLHLLITALLWSFLRNTPGKPAGTKLCLQGGLSSSVASAETVICAFMCLHLS